jgi:hypothetical protein
MLSTVSFAGYFLKLPGLNYDLDTLSHKGKKRKTIQRGRKAMGNKHDRTALARMRKKTSISMYILIFHHKRVGASREAEDRRRNMYNDGFFYTEREFDVGH